MPVSQQTSTRRLELDLSPATLAHIAALTTRNRKAREEAEQRRAERASRSGAISYLNNPAGFARDCIAWPDGRALAPYQFETLDALPARRRVSVRGPHGLGKSCTSALAVLWFALTSEAAGVDWKCVTTAGAWRQLEKYLWPEIHKWARLLRYDVLDREPLDTRSELLTLNLKLRNGAAFAVASDNPELIEGAHADRVLYVFDESKAISGATFDAAEGAFSGADDEHGIEAFALAMSTPGEPSGRFYDIHRRAPGLSDWWPRHVTLDEAIAAGRVSAKWAAERHEQWGDSAVYYNRVLGEFHTSDEDSVIPLAWIEAANERWRTWDEAGRPEVEGRRTVGVDVARTGRDKTVMALMNGPVVTELRHTALEDTMQTAGRVKGIVEADPGRVPVIDVIGIGAGVVDRLREQKVSVVAFNASEGTDRKDHSGELGFTNMRSGAWWNLRELLDPAYDAELALPPDDRLTGDLTAPHWRVMSGGKIQVESKDDIKKRIGRSTDDGDAVVEAAWAGDGRDAQAWIDHYRRKAAGAPAEEAPPTTPPKSPASQADQFDPVAARQAARNAAFRAHNGM